MCLFIYIQNNPLFRYTEEYCIQIFIPYQRTSSKVSSGMIIPIPIKEQVRRKHIFPIYILLIIFGVFQNTK